MRPSKGISMNHMISQFSVFYTHRTGLRLWDLLLPDLENICIGIGYLLENVVRNKWVINSLMVE